MKKHILPLLTALALCLALLPATALAEEAVPTGDITLAELEEYYGITISPSHLDFGTVYTGMNYSQEELTRYFTITNNSSTTFHPEQYAQTIFGFVESGLIELYMDRTGKPLKAGESLEVAVRLKDNYKLGAKSGTASFPLEMRFDLAGYTYIGPDGIAIGATGTSIRVEDALTVDYDIRGNEDIPEEDAGWTMADTFDIGTIDTADDWKTDGPTFTITNTGEYIIYVDAKVISRENHPRGDQSRGPFTLQYENENGGFNRCEHNMSLRPGETRTLRVKPDSYWGVGSLEGVSIQFTGQLVANNGQTFRTIEKTVSVTGQIQEDGCFQIWDKTNRTYGKLVGEDGKTYGDYMPEFYAKGEAGDSYTFTIVTYEKEKYYAKELLVDGVNVGEGLTSYTFTNLDDSHTIEAIFAPRPAGSVPPAQPQQPPAGGTAYASTQSVEVDGKPVEFQMYALKDANGNDTNYVKVRDVASVLSGTAAQFNVSWDGAVNLVPGEAYTPNGSEMKTPFSGNRTYTVPTAQTRVGGTAASLDAIVLTDDAGGGFTYYKLRDLGEALGFTVGWSAERGVFIETA